MFISAISLFFALPNHHHSAGLSYPKLLGSVFKLFVEEPVLRLRSVLGLLTFSLFALFWTPLAFLLAVPPYNYSDGVIGLFGLAGAVGAVAANWAGRMADRGRGQMATTVGLLVLLACWLPMAFAGHSLIALLIGVLALDFAVQLVHVSNQNAVFQVRPAARNRLNAGYITCYFIGGALGSLIGAQTYPVYGWDGIVVVGAVISTLALAIWGFMLQRESKLQPVG